MIEEERDGLILKIADNNNNNDNNDSNASNNEAE